MIARSSGHGYSFSGPPPDIHYPDSEKTPLQRQDKERKNSSCARKSPLPSEEYHTESEDRPTMSTVEEYSPSQQQALGGWLAWAGFS